MGKREKQKRREGAGQGRGVYTRAAAAEVTFIVLSLQAATTHVPSNPAFFLDRNPVAAAAPPQTSCTNSGLPAGTNC